MKFFGLRNHYINYWRVLMKIRLSFVLFFGLLCGSLFGQSSKLNPVMEPSLEELRSEFQKGPNRNYSTGPLWTWNDLLTETQVRETLQDLAEQKVKQVWVHPRPGLMTPYLSEAWFDMWKVSLDEAKKLDMNVWIYDENSYPSGFAGGFVPEAMPDSRGMGLRFEEVDKLDRTDDKDLWYVYRESGPGKYENITEEAKKNSSLPSLDNSRKYLLGRVRYAPEGGWFGGKWYVDLLKKGVTEKFIELTFDAYKNRSEIAGEFGNRVPGIFTDEPHPAGTYVGTWVSWNEEIPELFEKRFGYSLIDNAPSLHKPVGDWKKVRHNYNRLILELFIERWAKPCFEWCEANNLEFTGHYWEHGWPGTSHGPDNMAMYLWHQRPAIDSLMNQYGEGVNSQFGNARIVKELSSVANQSGRARTLCELYGAGGWDLRFEDMKRQADWINVLGVNTINEHLSYVTIRGARKRDHPQSFSYHTPWWEGYHVMAAYNTRLQYLLSQGRQINKVLILEPTTTAWMYQGDPKLGQIGNDFQSLINRFERNQIEYDLGSEDIIERLGEAEGNKFIVGKCEYDLVIFPPHLENLNRRPLELLAKYAKAGGKILICGEAPKYVEGEKPGGVEAQWLKLLEDLPNCEKSTVSEAVFAAKYTNHSFIKLHSLVSLEDMEKNHLFLHRRKWGGNEILFLCNSSLTETQKVSFSIAVDGNHFNSPVEEWNLFTGEMRPCDGLSHTHLRVGGEVADHFYSLEIPPAGSRILVVPAIPLPKSKPTRDVAKDLFDFVPGGEMKIERLEPNVLTLDYVEVTVKDETRKDVYYYKVNSWVFQKNGFRNNPWDNQVQFKDELISYEFPKDSGFTLKYKFTLKEALPDSLKFVVERPDLYTITCNGEPVSQDDGAWWLDKSFGVLNIRPIAKLGENEIVLTASPMSMWHEIEPAYVIGDFSLENVEKGYAIVPVKPLVLKPEAEAKEEGHSNSLEKVSWLTMGVGFPGKPTGKEDDREPFVVFDLGKEYDITGVKIWNYNEANLTKRGVKNMTVNEHPEMTELESGDVVVSEPYELHLVQSRGINGERPQKFDLDFKTRYVKFEILSNHAGKKFPLEGEMNVNRDDNAFVGLSEVRFLAKDAEGNTFEIPNVKIDSVSSELVNNTHDRKAVYMVDGSGLGEKQDTFGWNRQGMPFYASGVAYTQKFELTSKSDDGKYFVRLPESGKGWYGSTAKVEVNGSICGYVVSNPWQVDVTEAIKAGGNEITVTVIGTLKNTLGPHHSGRVRGSAWPGSFHPGPEVQPPGDAYDTIGYGLFEPFELIAPFELPASE